MKRGETVTKTISFSLGYTGSKEIKKVKKEFKSSFTYSYSTTISKELTCNPWTVVMWRPYSVWYSEKYSGTLCYTTIYVAGLEIHEATEYKTVTGTNKRLAYSADEAWSRVNSKHNVNAKTPIPYTTAPSI